MIRPIFLLGAVVGVLCGACGREPAPTTARLPAPSRDPARSSLLRLPHDGGAVRAYRVSDLSAIGWSSVDRVPPGAKPVGVDREQRLIYALDPKGAAVVLDLDSRRVRTILRGVRVATVGPDGALYAVDSANGVTQIIRRTPVRFASALKATPRQMFGTMSGALLAFGGGKTAGLTIVGADRQSAVTALPAGGAAATFWGDLVAVAADSAVVVYDPTSKDEPQVIDVSGHVKAVTFSPAAHRLYVARESPELWVLDRFSGDVLDKIDLPGAASGLRADLYGRWMLVRPAEGDSVWVVDASTNTFAGSIATTWAQDLPAVVGAGTLVVRRGGDVIGIDLTSDPFHPVGKIEDGATDSWAAIGWSPEVEPETPTEAADSTAVAADSAAGPEIYLQVSSSKNPEWARELSDKIRGAGLPASVLPPREGEDVYRVVLGPYATRDQADSASRKLGMPSFVTTGPDETPR